jgi:hypothetical protein
MFNYVVILVLHCATRSKLTRFRCSPFYHKAEICCEMKQKKGTLKQASFDSVSQGRTEMSCAHIFIFRFVRLCCVCCDV